MAVGTDAGPTAFAAGEIDDESSRPMLAACWAWRDVLEELMLWAGRGIASQTDPFRVRVGWVNQQKAGAAQDHCVVWWWRCCCGLG